MMPKFVQCHNTGRILVYVLVTVLYNMNLLPQDIDDATASSTSKRKAPDTAKPPPISKPKKYKNSTEDKQRLVTQVLVLQLEFSCTCTSWNSMIK